MTDDTQSTKDLLSEGLSEMAESAADVSEAPEVEAAPVEKDVKPEASAKPEKESKSAEKAEKEAKEVKVKSHVRHLLDKKEKAEAAQPEAAPEPVKIEDPIIAPRSLKADEKEAFNAAPRKIQEWIARREQEVNRGLQQKFQEFSAGIERNKGIFNAVQPYARDLALMGVPLEQGVANMAAWAVEFAKDKRAAAQKLLAVHGIDPRTFATGNPQAGQPVAQPAQQQMTLPPEVEARLAKLDELEAWRNEQQSQASEREMAQLKSVADNWKNQKDEQGNLLHPYVEELAAELQRYIPALEAASPGADPASIYEDAYQLAVKAHPDIRDAIAKRNEALQKAKEIEAARARSSRADRAAVSIRGSGNGPMAPAAMSQKDILRAGLNGDL